MCPVMDKSTRRNWPISSQPWYELYHFVCHLIYNVTLQYDLVGETDRKGDRDPKKRAVEIITKLDVGGDKKLNKQEFIAG